MEKETVLEIEFIPVWDKWAWKITKQDEEILKRGTFEDKGIGVYSYNYPSYTYYNCTLGIRGNNNDKDNLINLCTEDEKREIEVKVRNINEKYGIKRRQRADFGGEYCFIDDNFSIKWDRDKEYFVDNRKYENGNYFETKTEAEEYAEYMKKKSLEWHEKRGKNNGQEVESKET